MANMKVQSNQWLQKVEQLQKTAPRPEPAKPAENGAGAWIGKIVDHLPDFSSIQIPSVQLFVQSPTDMVDELRNAKGNEQYKLLLDFNQRLEQMSNKELKSARNYLGKLMADPKNLDDEFLGVLLNAVNQELDNRELGFQPLERHPIDIRFD